MKELLEWLEIIEESADTRQQSKVDHLGMLAIANPFCWVVSPINTSNQMQNTIAFIQGSKQSFGGNKKESIVSSE